VWLAIDDADEENSAMQVIPGTHRRGHLEWKNTDKPAVLNQEIVNIEQYGEPVSMNLKAGEVSLHADMIAHGSGPNTSDRRRCGLTIRYVPPMVRAVESSWAHNVIICRGSDPSGHWNPDMPVPEGDTLNPRAKPKAVGGN